MEDFRLRVFAAVCATGSFTKAAGILGISQPAVSQNISELEKDLGCQLFTRSAGKVAITPEGATLKHIADKIESSYRKANILFRTDLSAKTSYSLYVAPVVRDYLLEKILSLFSSVHPGISLSLAPSMGEADVCIIADSTSSGGVLSFRFYVVPESSPISKVLSAIVEEVLS